MLKALLASVLVAEAMCFAPSAITHAFMQSSTMMSALKPQSSSSSSNPTQGMSRRHLGLALGWAITGAPLAAFAEGEKDRLKIPESEKIKPRADGCAQGVGGKCDELNEGNPFIKELQERSAKNRVKYQKEELESYWRRNYKDFFDYACTGYDKKCDFRENPDGTWTVGVKPPTIQVKER